MFYHISHNDLDGYGCQLLVNEAINDVEFFNVNYGVELQEVLDKVPFILNKEDTLLITDLNLSEEQCAKLDLAANNVGFKIHLWDHHIAGEKQANKYDWYYLDSTKCATTITLEKLQELFITGFGKSIIDLACAINVYDIWQEYNSLMPLAKSLNQVFYENINSFPNELKNEERVFLFYLIKEHFINLSLKSIYDAEELIYSLKNKYFKQKFTSIDTPINNLPMHILKIHYLYEELMEKNTQFVFDINGLKGEVYFGLSNIFQEFSSIRLNEINSLDFIANINNKGYISFRTKKENVNLNELSKKYFFGGGHAKASGGSLIGAPKTFTKQEAFMQFISQIKPTSVASQYSESSQEGI